MKRIRGAAGLLFAGALLFAACGQKNGGEEGEGTAFLPEEGVSITGTYFPSSTPGTGSEGEENVPSTGTYPSDGVPGTGSGAEEGIPIVGENFPDAAFREYLQIYVDQDQDGKLSRQEREAIEGLGSVKSEGGLSDGNYILDRNKERGSKLQAIQSLEGIEYFINLKEICFEEEYRLENLPLDNPKLETVQVEATLQNFSIGRAPELCLLAYTVKGKQDLAWDNFPKLTDLKINGDEIKMEDLAKCRELTSLFLSGCVVTMPEDPEAFAFPHLSTMEMDMCRLEIPKTFETLTFSRIPLLEKFLYSESESTGGVPIGELDFRENESLKEVVFHAGKMAERVLLKNLNTYFWAEPEWKGCEVVFEEETMFPADGTLPEGSVLLTAENFPDVWFRYYLYRYADKDKDCILTKEELGNIRELNVWGDDPSVPYEEQEERAALLRKIYRFDGIEYLEDLTTFCLDYDSAAVSICLNHPRLQKLALPGGLEEFSIQHPENLQTLSFSSREGLKLDLSGMHELRTLNIGNVSADFTYLLQNKSLTRLYLTDCENLGETLEEYDFSSMEALYSVQIIPKEGTKPWAKRMCFGDSGYFTEDPDMFAWIWLGTDVTKEVFLENKNINCRAWGAEITYLDDTPGKDAGALPEGSIWNGTETIADMNFRCYLYQNLDEDRDNILTQKERERLVYFVDTGYDYDYGPLDEVNEYKWKVEDDMNPYVHGITSLRGFEYFPELKALQLEGMQLAEDVDEIVLTNPELEVLDLRFNGNVKTIDLTACKKLQICVIDSTRDQDFVQEVKPEILLPKHLKFETVEGMDCVVGEKAQERFLTNRK